MRAQISIDFVIAIIVFIIFSTYILFRILALRPVYLSEIENERIRSEAFQISEILVKDNGQPANWYLNPNQAKRIGLLNETFNQSNLLSIIKINQLNNICSNYDRVRELLDVKDLQFSILLVDSKSNILLNCIPPSVRVKTFGVIFTVERIVALDSGDYGILSVRVW